MDNDVQLSGSDKSAKPGGGGGNAKTYAAVGVVKDNIDPTRSGTIQVQLEGSTNPGSGSKSGTQWVKVRFLSTFFGSVKPTSGNTGSGTYKGNPSAYGQWQAPPDIGTKVLCLFAEGDPSRGFYVGCIPEPEMLQMVPAIGSSDKIVANEGEAKGYGGATRLPVTNINTNDKQTADSTAFNDQARPVHSYTASIMNQQGIIRDPIRGPISSSASREPASRVGWGVSTPGRPIYEGGYDDTNLPKNLEGSNNDQQLKVVARRGGHSIVMDDGDVIGRDQLVRIRTSLGHQILMSDDGQTLMILHANGQSYVELGKEGTVDIFSTNSINMRTQGDFNIHADQNINIHAMEKLNIQAKNIHVNSDEETKFRAGKDFKISTLANFTAKSAAASAINAGGEGSLVAGGAAFIVGSKVNLNSGNPGLSPEEVPIITLISQTDTLHDEEKGFSAAPGKLMTIASRAPAHMPWANAGQGVDVKNSPNASSNLPAAPAGGVQQANKAGAATGAAPPAVATVASVPANNPVSKSMDAGTTNAVSGAVATAAASGPAAAGVKQGAAIVPASSTGGSGTSNNSVAVGSFGQSPKQLVSSGVLKPGSDRLINGLASQANAAVNKVMGDSLFTGAPGAENITALAQSVEAQTASLSTNMQKAQTALTKAGVISGKEAATQLAGLVTAATTCGVEDTVNAVKGAANDLISQVPNLAGASGLIDTAANTANQLGAVANQAKSGAASALNMIGAGAAAAGLATSMGGLGGISSALKIMGGLNKKSLTNLLDSAKGVVGSAFDAIKDSFGELEANKPQNLTQASKESAAILAMLTSVVPNTNKIRETLATLGKEVELDELVADVFDELGDEFDNAIFADITNLADTNGSATIDNTIAGITGSVKNALSTLGNKNNNIAADIGATFSGLVPPSINLSSVTDLMSEAGFDNTAAEKITGLIDKVSGIPNSLINTPVLQNVNKAVNTISGIAGALPSLESGGLPELSRAAAAVQAGGAAAAAAQLASGISKMPGGADAIGATVNNALGAVNDIPGVSSLAGAIKKSQAAIANGLPNPSAALGAASSKLGGLKSMISSKLSSGGAAKLMSAVSSLGGAGGGAVPVKAPTTANNTYDRTGITAQIDKLIQDPGIPKPNLLGEIKDQLQAEVENARNSLMKQVANVEVELQQLADQLTSARANLNKAEADLPNGDPAIERARNKFLEVTKKVDSASKKLDELTGAGSASNNNPTQSFNNNPAPTRQTFV